MTRAFAASLGVAFVVVSAVSQERAAQRVAFGTVAEYSPGQEMFITNDFIGLELPVALVRATVYETAGKAPVTDLAAALTPGVRVRVWYRTLSEGSPVADRVRVFPTPRAARPPSRREPR